VVFTRRRIERAPGGGVRLRLPAGERTILRSVCAELQPLLAGDVDDPDLRRLYPSAYEDVDDEAAYRRLVRDGLVEGRALAFETLRATLDADRLSADEAQAWLTALNDARLVLGTRLDISEVALLAEIDPRDPNARELGLYLYLSWLLEQLVAALAPDLRR
jgi:hypothetical protein